MRLPEFITENIEPILADWEAFARSIWPGPATDALTLRDHAEDILRATARDMKSVQTPTQQSDKSKGEGHSCQASIRVDGASDIHAVGRVRSGFDLVAVVAEYRALRASVIRLWRESDPITDLADLDDVTRFNESIDQSLTEAVRSYTTRVDRARQMFLAILGHDLRNPLTSVIMSSQLLAQDTRLDSHSLEVASQIEASGTAMGSMISDLLDFTTAGLDVVMPLSTVPMDAGVLCREVIDEMRAAHPTRILQLESHGDLAGHWDPIRLRQVLSNLVGNAIQHGAAQAPITLSAASAAADVLITCHNDGLPIPPEVLPTLFDPLVRGMSAQSNQDRRPGSVGLGLFIAREVVAAHGGAIAVKSNAQTGTTFTVRLPRRKPQPPSRVPPGRLETAPHLASAPSARL